MLSVNGGNSDSVGSKRFPNDTPIRAGETVLVIARAGGMWWTNAARIVYVVDESDAAKSQFGFAYGTLPGHVETGEERFLIEWDRATDNVSFEILAFSRPKHLLVRLNKRRARDDAKAVCRGIDGCDEAVCERGRASALEVRLHGLAILLFARALGHCFDDLREAPHGGAGRVKAGEAEAR